MSVAELQSEPGRRERKKAATRQALQAAALALAEEHGVERVTVEAIAEAADVSARTFFNYFSCKEEALIGDPPAFDERLREVLAATPPGTPLLGAVRSVMTGFASEATGRREQILARKRLVRECPSLVPMHLATFAASERALVQAIADHLGTDPDAALYPALLAAVSCTALRVAYQRWEGSEDCPFETIVGEAFDTISRGL